MKPKEARYRAITQVKVLSPEIDNVSEADSLHEEASSTRISEKRAYASPTGSESMARYQKDRMGTWESHSIPYGVWNSKPEEGKILQKILWKSDKPIVVEKSRNGDGAKGLTEIRSGDRETGATHRSGESESTKLSRLTEKAKKDGKYRFMTLAYLMDEEYLKECFKELKRGKAAGVDGTSYEEYEEKLEENIKNLHKKLKEKKYKVQPVRRVYIPKGNGKLRPLGIPTVEDKIVQMALKKIIEAIFEPDFMGCSYGFRPGRNCHKALDEVDRIVMRKPINYVVDMDIAKFFDTVDHEWMMKFIKQRIVDRTILRLIGKFLRMGIMEAGEYRDSEEGVPQGGVLSPVLANIYLHYVLDLWFEKVVKKHMKGYAEMLRYADDFVVCFQAEKEAKEFSEKLQERIGKFGLRIAAEKSRIIKFGKYVWQEAQRQGKKVDTFNFLGFTHYCDKSRKGNFKLGRKTEKTRFRRSMKKINQWLRSVHNTMKFKTICKLIAAKLVGHYQYYGISGNMASISKYFWQVMWKLFQWLNRRCDKKSCTWEVFSRIVLKSYMPKPKIYHSYQAFKVRISEEPNDRIGHVRFCEGQ